MSSMLEAVGAQIQLCDSCGENAVRPLGCERCHRAFYCNVTCRIRDLPQHSIRCAAPGPAAGFVPQEVVARGLNIPQPPEEKPIGLPEDKIESLLASLNPLNKQGKPIDLTRPGQQLTQLFGVFIEAAVDDESVPADATTPLLEAWAPFVDSLDSPIDLEKLYQEGQGVLTALERMQKAPFFQNCEGHLFAANCCMVILEIMHHLVIQKWQRFILLVGIFVKEPSTTISQEYLILDKEIRELFLTSFKFFQWEQSLRSQTVRSPGEKELADRNSAARAKLWREMDRDWSATESVMCGRLKNKWQDRTGAEALPSSLDFPPKVRANMFDVLRSSE